jgi:hypothetical protein
MLTQLRAPPEVYYRIEWRSSVGVKGAKAVSRLSLVRNNVNRVSKAFYFQAGPRRGVGIIAKSDNNPLYPVQFTSFGSNKTQSTKAIRRQL